MIKITNESFDLETELKNVSSDTNGAYSFFLGTINLLNKSNNKMTQIPITFKDRKKGKSKIPRLEIIRTLKNLLFIKLGIIKK